MGRRFALWLTLALIPSLISLTAVPAYSAPTQTLTVYSDNEGSDATMLGALVTAFRKKYPNIQTTLTVAPNGINRPDYVKNSLDKGTMADVFSYYSGSLFQSLDPATTLEDLSFEPWVSTLADSFVPTVSVGTVTYGAPLGSSMGGGILYNKSIYAKLKLKIPLTWNQFMANNAKIKSAGIIPVVETFKDAWTAQMLILADAFNLVSADPEFPGLYTSNRANYSSTPAALVGFKHLEQIYKLKYMNSDYKTATQAQGLKYLVAGKAANYPMLSLVEGQLATRYPKSVNNIGIFAQPGPTEKSNGLTVWMPDALYIPKNAKDLNEAKEFIAFAISPAGVSVTSQAVRATGPYMIKNAKIATKQFTISRDISAYLRTPGTSGPALEFLTPVKGPNLPKISIEVGTGLLSAVQGAKAYDADVKAESARIGLPGWGKLPQ